MSSRIVLLAAVFAAACSDAATPVGEAPPPAPAAARCGPPVVSDFEVSSEEMDGFPPYAASDCSVAYIDRAGALVVLDTSGGAPKTLAPADEMPRRPSTSAELTAWEATLDGVDVVRVRHAGQTRTIPGGFAAAGEPRVRGASVVFTAWTTTDRNGDTDVWLYDASTGAASVVFGGPAQQRFADVSDRYVALTDFGEDPDGRYDRDGDLADVVLVDRQTRDVTRRSLPGKQGFPMLVAGGVLAYLDWNLVHPEPKLEAYRIKVGEPLSTANDRDVADVRYLGNPAPRPSASDGRIWWVANPDGKTTLWKAEVRATVALAPIDVGALVVHAPAAAPGFSWVATSDAPGALRRLRVVR